MLGPYTYQATLFKRKRAAWLVGFNIHFTTLAGFLQPHSFCSRTGA